MKKLISLLLLALLLCGAAQAEEAPQPADVTGSWSLTAMSLGGYLLDESALAAEGLAYTMTLNEDGTALIDDGVWEDNGEWTSSGAQVVVTTAVGVRTFTLEDDQLIDDTMILSRVNPLVGVWVVEDEPSTLTLMENGRFLIQTAYGEPFCGEWSWTENSVTLSDDEGNMGTLPLVEGRLIGYELDAVRIGPVPAALRMDEVTGTWIPWGFYENDVLHTVAELEGAEDVSITLQADGDILAEARGDQETGTWELLGPYALLTIDGEMLPFTVVDGRLQYEQRTYSGMYIIVFARADDSHAAAETEATIDPQDVIGEWNMEFVRVDGQMHEVASLSADRRMDIDLYADGTTSVDVNGSNYQGTWRISGSSIIVDVADDPVAFMLEDGRLVCDISDDVRYILTPGSSAEPAEPFFEEPEDAPAEPAIPVEAVLGEWLMLGYMYDGEIVTLAERGAYAGEYMLFTLHADGTFQFMEIGAGESNSGTWSISGDEVLFAANDDTERLILRDGMLVAEMGQVLARRSVVEVQGLWYLTGMQTAGQMQLDVEDLVAMEMTRTLYFTADGRMRACEGYLPGLANSRLLSQTTQVSWTMEGGRILTTLEDFPVTFTVADGVLTGEMANGVRVTLTRTYTNTFTQE